MPFRVNEPYEVHMAPWHPPIFEQGGHFFYPDGCEIPFEVVKKILDYNEIFCRRYKVPLNIAKHRLELKQRELEKMGREWEWDVTHDSRRLLRQR